MPLPGQSITPAVVVRLLDANGNPVSGASVALALSSGTGTLSGVPTPAPVTDANGNATFSSLSVDQAGAKQLTASSGNLVVASNQFDDHGRRGQQDRLHPAAHEHGGRIGHQPARRGPDAGRQQ